jgi:MFS family permease
VAALFSRQNGHERFVPYIGKDLNLDTTQQGLIISAFFIGYAAFQIPGGLLADKFGSRKIMAIGIAWWSVFTSLTGAVLTLPLMLAVRFFFGIGEGASRRHPGR